MFVQIIRGKVRDPEALKTLVKQWDNEIRPQASGFLGSTWGITDSGDFVVAVRFESEDAKNSLSDSELQDAWYQRFVTTLESEPTFEESGDITVMGSGGTNSAGFVQVIDGSYPNRELWEEFGAESEELGFPPHILGGWAAHLDGNRFIQAVYFTSEDEARAKEAEGFGEPYASYLNKWQETLNFEKFTDLKEPQFQN